MASQNSILRSRQKQSWPTRKSRRGLLRYRSSTFYRHFIPLRKQAVELLADTYRRYFKVAVASKVHGNPDLWAKEQLRPAISLVIDWMRDWYILACDGENRSLRRLGSMKFIPEETVSLSIPTSRPPAPPRSWRAPTWLFAISPLSGIGPLKPQHVPARDYEEKLGEAHTRLLLGGARRVLLSSLASLIESVRNEEIAEGSAIRGNQQERRRPNKRKGWEQRLKLYDAIRKVLNGDPTLQGMEFCNELDKRHASPLLDWTERGEWRDGLTWKEAWDNPNLRRKIRRVRQEAQKAS